MSTLSQSDVSRFRDDGFVVVRGLLTADETNRMAHAARTEFETHRYLRSGRSSHEGGGSRYPAPRRYILSEDSLRLADIRQVVDHPHVVAAAAELLRDDVCLSAFAIFGMPPGSAGTYSDTKFGDELAHWDYRPARPVGSSLRWLFVIVPLEDYTEAVGPLLVSPGSHKLATLTRRGRITHVRAARNDALPAFVDARLRRGDVLFMDGFVWHLAHRNRSDRLRFGVYNKYRARSAPPGCGPYLFRASSAALFDAAGRALLSDHAPGRISETRLLVEDDDERFLLLDSAVPGGPAQTDRKRVGSDDDNVIAQLLVAVKPQIHNRPPWVSYVGDYPVGDGDRCRVYACPRAVLTDPRLAVPGARWLTAERLGDETGRPWLSAAAARWLRDPLLRGIGQSYAQGHWSRFVTGASWTQLGAAPRS